MPKLQIMSKSTGFTCLTVWGSKQRTRRLGIAAIIAAIVPDYHRHMARELCRMKRRNHQWLLSKLTCRELGTTGLPNSLNSNGVVVPHLAWHQRWSQSMGMRRWRQKPRIFGPCLAHRHKTIVSPKYIKLHCLWVGNSLMEVLQYDSSCPNMIWLSPS